MYRDMDVAHIREKNSPVSSRRLRRVLLSIFSPFSLGIFELDSANILFAQSNLQPPAVQLALEPQISGSKPLSTRKPSLDSKTALTLSQAKPTPDEPERIPKVKNGENATEGSDARKRATSFLPAQRPIGQVSIDVRPKSKGTSNAVPENLANQALGEVPVVLAARSDDMLGDTLIEKRINSDQVFPYQPLYFEEVNLERYGRSCGVLQPVVSGVRFFATIPSLPYAMTLQQPNQTYTFRWPYEAGWGAPKVRELQPLQWKPGVVQASAITGLLFVVP